MKTDIENELVEKAYSIDFNKIVDSELYESLFGEYCYAESKSEAGKKLYNHFKDIRLVELTNGGQMNERNVPVRRNPDLDMVIYDGRVITSIEAFRLERFKNHREEVNSILDNNPNATHFYLTKARIAYYLNDNDQYTTKKFEAQVYTREEATRLSMNGLHTFPIPIDNKQYNDELRQKFLPEDVT